LLATDIRKLRSVGLSRQKASYMHSLAEHFVNGRISNQALSRLSDEDVIEHVTQIRGIGNWTAHMLLMFSLGRPDVLPTGDLGVQKAIEDLYKLDQLPNPQTMTGIAEPWRPYRTIASWYLWRTRDTLTL
jgi:DNA-3-methyladenine glycosylase II